MNNTVLHSPNDFHWNDKSVLVTGGAGFIGSHLCTALIRRGARVLALDNLMTGSLKNIAQLRTKPGFTFLEGDVSAPLVVEVDFIFNLACPASPVHYQRTPVETMRASVMGAFNVLELARKTGATVFQASTSEIYGDPLEHPQSERYWGHVNPIGARACYNEGKRCAEALFFSYAQQHGVGIKVARFFNTYGPNMRPDDGRVVSNFILQTLRGNAITVYGDGQQTRSFCYVDDLIEGILRLAESETALQGPINLGNPEETTVVELARLVTRLCGANNPIRHETLPADDPLRRRPDITLARKHLGWQPQVKLEDGLRTTIAFFAATQADSVV